MVPLDVPEVGCEAVEDAPREEHHDQGAHHALSGEVGNTESEGRWIIFQVGVMAPDPSQHLHNADSSPLPIHTHLQRPQQGPEQVPNPDGVPCDPEEGQVGNGERGLGGWGEEEGRWSMVRRRVVRISFTGHKHLGNAWRGHRPNTFYRSPSCQPLLEPP